MEVVEYLRGAGRRKWILVALPLALVAVAVPWASSQPQQFRTVSTVSVQPSTGFQGPSAIRSFVDTFVQVSESDAVLDRAAADSGVPIGDFRDSLSVTPVGGSPLVEVQVTTPNRNDGETVTGAVIRSALAISLDALIAQAKVEVEAVRADVQRVVDRLDAIERESGELLPPEAYRLALSEVVRIESALANGGTTPGGVSVSEADLAAAQAVLRETRQAAQEYQLLVVDRSQKQNQVTIVEARLSQYEERKDQIDGAVFDSSTKPVSQRPLLIQAVVAALVAGLLLASAALVVVERWRRRRSGTGSDAGEVAAVAVPPARGGEPDRAGATGHSPLVTRDQPSATEGGQDPNLPNAGPGDSLPAMGAGRER